MTEPHALHRPRPPRGGLRCAAAATALAFGCVTAHPPGRAPLVGPPPAKVRIAEPEIYLSVEATSSIQPEEWNEAGAQTRAALTAALASRFPSADGEADADAVLTVREHAVARTGGRKASQVLAVVAIVAVIVIVVVAMFSSRGNSKSSRAKSGGRPAPAPSARPPSPSAPRAAPAPPSAGPPAASPAASPPIASHPISPAPPAGAAGRPGPRTLPAPGAAPAGPAGGGGVGVEVDVGIALAVPVGEPPPPYPMPPPPPFDPEERGFFAGDEVVLELELRDAKTDQVIWANALKRGADPKDQAAVAALLDEVLAGEAWSRKSNQSR